MTPIKPNHAPFWGILSPNEFRTSNPKMTVLGRKHVVGAINCENPSTRAGST